MNYNSSYLVNVRCATFNHSKYIEQAMNGFVMQETNFPFICSIIDDSSTDGEQVILKKYLEEHFELSNGSALKKEETDDYVLTLTQHKTNKNCFFAVLLLKYNHYGDLESQARRWYYLKEWEDTCNYIAICEGDDYWIDPHKLQKQVNFMETHSDYTMCFHNANIYNESGTNFNIIHVEDREYNMQELFDRWVAPTASLLIRSKVIKGLPFDAALINGDINIVLNACNHGKVYGMSDVMSVYRVQNNGLTLKRSRENPIGLALSYVGHYKALGRLYPQINKLAIRNITDVYISISLSILKKNPLKSGLYFLKAIYTSPRRVATRIVKYLR